MILATRMQDLHARLAKGSHNNSKPPSGDGLAGKTTSLRRWSGKKPGGQIGHRGETLRLVVTLDVVQHRPAGFPPRCPVACNMGRGCVRSQCIWWSSCWCPTARVRKLLADLVGAVLSLGTLVEWVQVRRSRAKRPASHHRLGVHQPLGPRQAQETLSGRQEPPRVSSRNGRVLLAFFGRPAIVAGVSCLENSGRTAN